MRDSTTSKASHLPGQAGFYGQIQMLYPSSSKNHHFHGLGGASDEGPPAADRANTSRSQHSVAAQKMLPRVPASFCRCLDPEARSATSCTTKLLDSTAVAISVHSTSTRPPAQQQ